MFKVTNLRVVKDSMSLLYPRGKETGPIALEIGDILTIDTVTADTKFTNVSYYHCKITDDSKIIIDTSLADYLIEQEIAVIIFPEKKVEEILCQEN